MLTLSLTRQLLVHKTTITCTQKYYNTAVVCTRTSTSGHSGTMSIRVHYQIEIDCPQCTSVVEKGTSIKLQNKNLAQLLKEKTKARYMCSNTCTTTHHEWILERERQRERKCWRWNVTRPCMATSQNSSPRMVINSPCIVKVARGQNMVKTKEYSRKRI